MVDNGWIKLHRKFLKWEWYTDANTKAVFLHLLLNANYEERKWRGKTIEVGEVITSVKSLSRDLKLSVKQVRTALEHLKSTNEVAIKGANKYSVIKVCNYGIYQELEFPKGQTEGQTEGQTNGEQEANKGQTKGKQRATPKEIKEIKNVRNKELEKKDIYGEYGHVLLTDEERNRLFDDYGEAETLKAIDYLDKSIEMKGYKYKSHNLALRKWVFRAMKEDEERAKRNAGSSRMPKTEQDLYGGIMEFLKGD